MRKITMGTQATRGAATLVALAALLAPAAASAQSLERRVAAADDGVVRLSFTARDGVCGNGRSIHSGRSPEWESLCDDGPVRVSARVRDGRVTKLRTYVGGRWRDGEGRVTELGAVSAPEASQWLLGLARTAPGDVGEDAVFAATLADSTVVWPELLELAKERRAPRETRRAAIFWLGQAAAADVGPALGRFVDDDSEEVKLREHAVFALSQRPADEAVPALIRIATGDVHPALRRKALFWLGDSGDPRAIALFERILAN